MKVRLTTATIRAIGFLNTERMRDWNQDRKNEGREAMALAEYISREAQFYGFVEVIDGDKQHLIAARHVIEVEELTDVSDL